MTKQEIAGGCIFSNRTDPTDGGATQPHES